MSPWRTPIRAPDLAELESLVACAVAGSLAGAATELGISRPAVAKRISNLEALAGRPLLHRGSHGVSLTDAGADVLAGARRILEERELLVGLLTEIRTRSPWSIAGLRELLGTNDLAERAGQLPETKLADMERVLELLLRATNSGVVITEINTGIVHLVNDAFCALIGRTRSDLLGQPLRTHVDWYQDGELNSRLRQTGVVEKVIVAMPQPDGSEKVGEANAYALSLGGRGLVLTVIEHVTRTEDMPGIVTVAHG